MNREELIKRICPFDIACMCHSLDDNSINCSICKEELNRILDEYDAKVRADAIDEVIKSIDDEYFDGGYGDYHEVAMIVRMLNQLKEQRHDKAE